MAIFAQKLKEHISRRGIIPASLASRSGVSEPSISRFLSGKHVPTDEKIRAFAEILELSQVQINELLFLAAAERSNAPEMWHSISQKVFLPNDGTPGVILSDPMVIPIYKTISCGDGSGELAGEKAFYDQILIAGISKNAFGMIAEGDSMNGPDSWIRPGEILVFEPWDGPPQNGKIYALCLEGWRQLVAKRVMVEPDGTVFLKSDNPAYNLIPVPAGTTVIVRGILKLKYTKLNGK